jgi:hypothetical protein
MITWIESQDTAIIALLVFVLCYAIAVAVLAAAAAISRRRIAVELKALTPVMLTPLSVISGLLIAFLATHVWSNLDRANAFVAQEANAVSESVLLANALPKNTRNAVHQGLKTYRQFIENEDWPAMLAGRANFRQAPPGLTEAMAALLLLESNASGQQIAQHRTVIALQNALEARRSRILLSSAVIAPVQWLVILTLDALVLMTIAMVHFDHQIAAAAGIFIFSTAVAACLVLLMINDRPFSDGGFTIEPVALRQIDID